MRRLLSLRGTFRSLRKYNYRAYFVVAALSNLGTWIQLVTENWLILKLGGSGLALGITSGLQFLPVLVLSVYGGVVADRADKRRLLTILQSLMALPPLLLGILIALGQVHIWLVWTAAFLVEIINAFSSPTIQAFAFELAGPDDVTKAVALNSTVATLRTGGGQLGGCHGRDCRLFPFECSLIWHCGGSPLINAALGVVCRQARARVGTDP